MSIEKKFCKFVSLNVFAMVGMSCYILADTFFISVAEGADGITALNLVLPVYSLIFAIGSMLGAGAATRYGIAKAAGNRQADRYFFNAVCFALLFGVCFSVVGGLAPEAVLRLLGGDRQIIAVGANYTRIFMLFAPCFMLNYIFTSFIRNDNAPLLSMIATLTSSFSNILLDYLFMFPLKMGMPGAALATGLSPVISIAVCSLHFLSGKSAIPIRPALPSGKLFWQSCQLGVAGFVGEISSGITTMVFNFLILALAGNVGVAAYAVIANLAIVGTAFFNGIAQGEQPLASEAYGKGDATAQGKIRRLSLQTAAVTAVVIVSLVLIFAEPCVRLFNREASAQLAAYAEPGLRLYILGFLFAGINIVGTGYLSATEQAKAAFFVAVLRGLAAIVGFAFLLSKLLGMLGIWLAFPVAEAFCMLFTLIALQKQKQRAVAGAKQEKQK